MENKEVNITQKTTLDDNVMLPILEQGNRQGLGHTTKDKGQLVNAIKPKANKLTSFLNTLKKVSLEKFIEWSIEKGGKLGGYF